jgi:glycosyltransferase involved in cell wall biosynthesis
LVHAHELLSPTTTAVISKRLFGVPVVAKVLRGGQLGDIAELKRHSTGPRRLAIMRRYVDGFITISQEIDRELAALGVPQEKRPFIPNGVDTARFAPVDTQQREVVRRELSLPDGPIAVFTGRLSKEKQIDQLINVWPQVRAVHPQASLLLLGTGDQEATLKRSAGAGVVFGGVVSNVAPYLQGADLFVLPSATEGLSNALLEAMATGLPVVASNVGGAPDLIKHGYNGRLISPESPTDIVESIIALFDDQAQRTQLGQQARQKVQRDYALPSIVNKLCDLYEHLLSV